MMRMWKIAHIAPASSWPRKQERAAERQRGAHAEQGNQHEQQFARVHVAEQSHRQRHGLRQQLDHVQRKIGNPQQRIAAKGCRDPFVRVTADALGTNRSAHDQHQNDDCHGDRAVQIGSRQYAPVLGAKQARNAAGQIERQQVHRVHGDDPGEEGERQGDQEGAIAVVDVGHLAIDEFVDHLDERDEARWNAGMRLARTGVQEPGGQCSQQARHEQGIDVPCPKAFTHLEMGQVMDDVRSGRLL